MIFNIQTNSDLFNAWINKNSFPKIFYTYTRKQQFKIFINRFFLK